MDDTRLANDVVDYLVPFLKDLILKHPLSSDADPGRQQVYALWDEIYPKIALRSGVMMAARKIVEENTPENRTAFSNQLALVFRNNSFLAEKISERLPGAKQDFLAEMPEPQAARVDYQPAAEAFEHEFGADKIACQVCGRQDPTLRLVSYPFVFSLVVVTFRRIFQGVYCSRHAKRYFFLAVLISISVGWLGIPFGLIFTPITLINLFVSDKRLRTANAKLLTEIAKSQQEKGNQEEAAGYFLEALWLEKKQKEALAQKMKGVLPQVEPPAFISQVVSLLSGFMAAWLLGFLIGLVDGLISTPFSNLQGQVSILVIIFSYLPLVLMLYFGAFVLVRLVRWMLERTLISNVFLGRLLAGIMSVMAFYALLTGNLFSLVHTNSLQSGESLVDLIRMNGLLLVHGGWLKVWGLLQEGSLADLLFVVLTIFGLMAFFWLSQDWASRTVDWRRALLNIQPIEAQESTVWVGFTALVVLAGVALLLGLLFFPTEILFN